MSNQFNWQIEEDPKEPTPLKARKGWWSGVLVFWVLAIGVILLLLGSWFVSQRRGQEDRQYLVDTAQEFLDLQQQALSMGDGELYFSLQDRDPDWFVAQLLPANQKVTRAGLEVTNAEQVNETIWVNATWQEKGQTLQRIVFLQWRAGQLRQLPTDPNYWGTQIARDEEWGTLVYHAVDDPWAAPIGNFVSNKVADICADSCLEDRLPFMLDVRDDFQVTAEPNRVTIPSARLLGLNIEGKPSARFWNELSQRIDAYLTPATIRFAVPPPRSYGGYALVDYADLADRFSVLHPEITVELIYLDSLPEDFASLTLDFDGAAFPPSEAMLTAGHVHDLHEYISSDPDFDRADFYEQIWQGTVWRGRTWFMPQAAEMRIMYYDRSAYQKAGHSDPSSKWTWDEMAQDVATIVSDQPQRGDLTWGFLDVGLDALFSYAYNWNNQCIEEATIFCQIPLQDQNVAAALDWYYQMTSQPEQMPDLVHKLPEIFSPTQMSFMETMLIDDPQSLLRNIQGSRRKAAIWVDLPVNYEFNLLLSPVGVVPFPGSDRFDGITPLWLQGSFISQHSERPFAVWQWLKFLSYQSPTPRLVPARPSVAADMGFWTELPLPLGNVMRTAFPFARPVTIAEQSMLTWEQVAAVINGEATPLQAAQQQPHIAWFSERLKVNP